MGTGPLRTTRQPVTRALTGLLVAVLGAAALVACGSDDDGGSAGTETPRSPKTTGFTGTAPSAVASLAESVKESLSAAASSASARASEFEASVSAEVARANAAAKEQLDDVEGRGNATADVSLTGKPRAQTDGLLAVVVNITNSTDRTASYAVQVDFSDSDGQVVETRYVGAEDLEPGERAQPLAISRKPPEPKLTAEIAKAQRY
ncbi:FxLYD domain-containing protein [Streptomyces sp. P17]|uniref:FxLYD domain-containing protein n=1 Tax=Streptomyces sp. P17 TaxID=3074716 RepID=UPI0028F4608B|nr:FxLYD domain-containing protein [Streptomyces sp. P17]MDT9696922.1 FxLYD domain-containing protein [Streptomyces sp. P17]